MSNQYTRIRPHWRPTHNATPESFDLWIGGDGPNGWVKILNPDGHHVRQVWEQAPQANIVLRNHPISEQKDDMRRDPIGTARRHVNFWMQWCIDQGLDRTDDRLCFEGINEAAIWEPGVTEALVRYTNEYIVASSDGGIIPAVLQMNTGWPTNHGITDGPPDWSPYESVFAALKRFGGYLCLHEYWDRRGPDSDDWGWNPGRFTQLPDSARGIPLLITECGYDLAVNAPSGTPHHGWHGHISKEDYLQQLYSYDLKLRESGWDVRAAFVFTHDFDEPWGTFDTRPITQELAAHAHHIRQLPAPVPQPGKETTPTPSGPTPEQGGESWERSISWILAWEGGYQGYFDMPQNWTGGAHKRGVLKGSAYGIYASRFPDLTIHSLTPEQASEIHYREHWLASQAHQLPWPYCLVVFDTAIVHGVNQTRSWLKESPSAAHFLSKRLTSYVYKAEWNTYAPGWVRRVADLLEEMGTDL